MDGRVLDLKKPGIGGMGRPDRFMKTAGQHPGYAEAEHGNGWADVAPDSSPASGL